MGETPVEEALRDPDPWGTSPEETRLFPGGHLSEPVFHSYPSFGGSVIPPRERFYEGVEDPGHEAWRISSPMGMGNQAGGGDPVIHGSGGSGSI